MTLLPVRSVQEITTGTTLMSVTKFYHTKYFFLIHPEPYHSFASQYYFFCISA